MLKNAIIPESDIFRSSLFIIHFLFLIFYFCMHVHHHSEHNHQKNHQKKKWREYAWEFIMLFAAVFCGFIAENLREHYVEHIREKKYIRSIIKDLQTDTTWMNSYMDEQWQSIQACDSVIILLNQPLKDSFAKRRLYYLARMVIKKSSPNKINYSAYDQMRSSGNLRLIKSQSTLDSITNYYFKAMDIEQLNQTIMQRQSALVEFEGKIFDGAIFQRMEDLRSFKFREPKGNPALISTDRSLINDLVMRAHYLGSANSLSRSMAGDQKQAAISLIGYLKHGYHIK
jgi:hypothetical protein